MADGTNRATVAQWLGHDMPANPTPRMKRRAAVAGMTLQVLEHCAPDVLALDPEADWSPRKQELLQQAIARIERDEDQRDVHNSICFVMGRGNHAGIWSCDPWPLRAVVQLAPSRVTRADIALFRKAQAVREKFFSAIAEILKSEDFALLRGALLVSAALCSAVIRKDHLLQVLRSPAEVQAESGLAWLEFQLGTPKQPWRNVRRWLIDPVSLQLIDRLAVLEAGCHAQVADPKQAMKAISAALIGSADLTLIQLLRMARVWWATRLMPCQHDYALRQSIGMSLPSSAWHRLLRGQPLPRSLRADTAPSNDGAEDPIDGDGHRHVPKWKSTPLMAQEAALADLKRILGRGKQQKKLKVKELKALLDEWTDRNADRGGWAPLLGEWVRSTLFNRDAGPFGRGQGPRVAGILRYLEGFARRFLWRFWDRPIECSEPERDWLPRMEQLRKDLSHLKSRSVSKSGLISFLRFAERYGAPRTELGEDWRIMVHPSEASANLLTPIEYVRLRDWLQLQFHGVESSYPAMRVQAMLIIAYRMGPRWEELQTLRLRDIVFTSDPVPRGSIWFRKNEYADGKTRESRRTLSLEHFLSTSERCLLKAFLEMASQLGGATRPMSGLLFADPGALAMPPLERGTRDLIQMGMREISGDRTLVFHHLRHSAASFLYLRLLVDEKFGKSLQSIIPGWKHVSAAEILGEDLDYSVALIGRGPGDPSRLYVVSEVLGHMDPETSLESYIHLADILMFLTLRECLSRDLPAQVAADLDKIKLASARRRKYRAHREVEHAA